MNKNLISAIVAGFLLSGCEQKNDDKVKAVDKTGSVEMKVAINHLNASQDVMRTEKVFWVKGAAVRSIVNLDTVPALGVTREVAENSAGEDTTVSIKKNYQIFITVK
jgi:protein involved in sex pheromone biosynthesis